MFPGYAVFRDAELAEADHKMGHDDESLSWVLQPFVFGVVTLALAGAKLWS